jgi:hypothetical protein
MSSSWTTPQAIPPATMNVMPPNILFSTTAGISTDVELGSWVDRAVSFATAEGPPTRGAT